VATGVGIDSSVALVPCREVLIGSWCFGLLVCIAMEFPVNFHSPSSAFITTSTTKEESLACSTCLVPSEYLTYCYHKSTLDTYPNSTSHPTPIASILTTSHQWPFYCSS
jgi:hypothetical protein